jgi:hypothetical protein
VANFVRFAIPNIYIGASTDTKPAAASVGSLCYEHDTGDWYITTDGSTWTLYKGDTTWLHS